LSLLNIALHHDHALVAVDTRARVMASTPAKVAAAIDGTGEATKMIHLSSANAVLAGRGMPGFLAVVQFFVMLRYCTGFDGLVRDLPGLLPQCWEAFEQQLRQAGVVDSTAQQAQEVAVVGWSEQQQRMVAVVFAQELAAEGFERFDIVEPWCTPWFPEMGEPPTLVDEFSMLSTAYRQVEHSAAVMPDMPVGGGLVLARLTRLGASIERRGEL
jgi:hypothetical protein